MGLDLTSILLIGLILGILIGSFIVGFINYKKIFLKTVGFLENKYNIPKPLIFSLYNVNNRDGFLSLWRKPINVFFAFIPFIFTILVLILITLIFLFATNYIMDDIFSYIIYPTSLISLLPGWLIVWIKIKKLMTLEKFYRDIPLSFKYSKIIFRDSQKDVNKIENYLMQFYKQVKPFYNRYRFSLFTIQSNFNYYFVYLRAIGHLLKSEKIINFLEKNTNIEIIIDNRRVDFNEFKQVLLNNFFCVFYYFNFYGCSSNFLDDFQEFENSEIIKNGYKFNEIKETDLLVNGGTRFIP